MELALRWADALVVRLVVSALMRSVNLHQAGRAGRVPADGRVVRVLSLSHPGRVRVHQRAAPARIRPPERQPPVQRIPQGLPTCVGVPHAPIAAFLRACGGAVKAAWSGTMCCGATRGECASEALTAPSTPVDSRAGACVFPIMASPYCL